jgi:NitT/TauT family transport system substrate-binding protein
MTRSLGSTAYASVATAILAAGLLITLPASAQTVGSSQPSPISEAGKPLAIYGNITVFEIAPVLIAADRLYGDAAIIRRGGVPYLFPGAPLGNSAAPGLADVSTNAETQALRVSVKNPELRIVMTVSEGLYRLVGRKSAGIRTIADLKGKRIATIPTTSSGYFLHKMLKTAGLSYADVTVVPIMPLSDMPKALAEGKVDAVTIWEPEMENAVRALGSDAIEFSGKGIYREIFNLNTTAAALADPGTRKRIVELVRAIIAASADVRADPSLAWRYVEAIGAYKTPLIAASWAHHSFPATLAPDLLDVMVEEEQFLAGNEGRAPRSRETLATLIDTSVLAEALAPGPIR